MPNFSKLHPDIQCSWCDSASTLEVEWTEMGVQFCVCSCCGKRTRVVHGVAYRSGPATPVPASCDINGVPMLDP